MHAAEAVNSDLDLLGFSLVGLDGKHHSLASLTGSVATVILFIGNGCPTVRAYEERLKALQERWSEHGVRVVAVNSNNPYLSPPDTISEMTQRARSRQFNFPYMKDEAASLAKHMGAVCTPHAFVLDKHLAVAYSGRIDDSRVGDTITSHDLENAVTSVVSGRAVTPSRTEPFGCSIVW